MKIQSEKVLSPILKLYTPTLHFTFLTLNFVSIVSQPISLDNSARNLIE